MQHADSPYQDAAHGDVKVFHAGEVLFLWDVKIGREKIIPAMQKGLHCDIATIASRNIEQARIVAGNLKIKKVCKIRQPILRKRGVTFKPQLL